MFGYWLAGFLPHLSRTCRNLLVTIPNHDSQRKLRRSRSMYSQMRCYIGCSIPINTREKKLSEHMCPVYQARCPPSTMMLGNARRQQSRAREQ